MKEKKNTAELKMMNMKKLQLIGLIFLLNYNNFYYRTLDRKAVDMLSAKVKEKANALKEYLKDRPEAEF